jgi:hypothetical protein
MNMKKSEKSKREEAFLDQEQSGKKEIKNFP